MRQPPVTNSLFPQKHMGISVRIFLCHVRNDMHAFLFEGGTVTNTRAVCVAYYLLILVNTVPCYLYNIDL